MFPAFQLRRFLPTPSFFLKTPRAVQAGNQQVSRPVFLDSTVGILAPRVTPQNPFAALFGYTRVVQLGTFRIRHHEFFRISGVVYLNCLTLERYMYF